MRVLPDQDPLARRDRSFLASRPGCLVFGAMPRAPESPIGHHAKNRVNSDRFSGRSSGVQFVSDAKEKSTNCGFPSGSFFKLLCFVKGRERSPRACPMKSCFGQCATQPLLAQTDFFCVHVRSAATRAAGQCCSPVKWRPQGVDQDVSSTGQPPFRSGARIRTSPNSPVAIRIQNRTGGGNTMAWAGGSQPNVAGTRYLSCRSVAISLLCVARGFSRSG